LPDDEKGGSERGKDRREKKEVVSTLTFKLLSVWTNNTKFESLLLASILLTLSAFTLVVVGNSRVCSLYPESKNAWV
jgi:hypothetical protein